MKTREILNSMDDVQAMTFLGGLAVTGLGVLTTGWELVQRNYNDALACSGALIMGAALASVALYDVVRQSRHNT